jgi:hypothetical protein
MMLSSSHSFCAASFGAPVCAELIGYIRQIVTKIVCQHLRHELHAQIAMLIQAKCVRRD